MRTSTTIVEKIERLFLHPGWQFVHWHFMPPYRPSRYARWESPR